LRRFSHQARERNLPGRPQAELLDWFEASHSHLSRRVIDPVRNHPAADDLDLVDSAIVCRRLEITREGGAISQAVKEYLYFPPR
jgi:hypothetical protein